MEKRNNSLFDFFDVVQVVDARGEYGEIDRLYGVVVGKVYDDSQGWYYSVAMYEDSSCKSPLENWAVYEDCLVATGKSVSEDHIYGDESIRVSKTGEILE